MDQTTVAGGTATFGVTATGTPPLTYQWQIMKAGDAAFSDIPGATSPSYTIPPAAVADDNTQFKLRVTNDLGSTDSSIVTLHVQADSTPPTLVSAVGSASMDKITVVSTGGDAAGLNKITGDLTKMAAQIPALFETLSGMPINELFAKVRTIGDKGPRPDDQSKGASA